jgi:hypothetical protein
MSLSAKQIIAIRAPQHSADTRLDDFIELAEMQTSTCFGDRYELAVALRVLHLLTLEDMRGGSATDTGIAIAGTITSESEGQLSRSYGSTAQDAAQKYNSLSCTAYGLELVELIESTMFKPRTRIMSGC